MFEGSSEGICVSWIVGFMLAVLLKDGDSVVATGDTEGTIEGLKDVEGGWLDCSIGELDVGAMEVNLMEKRSVLLKAMLWGYLKGASLGRVEGAVDGELVGKVVEAVDGDLEGGLVGLVEGSGFGNLVDFEVGFLVGVKVDSAVGVIDPSSGESVGASEVSAAGALEGDMDGETEPRSEGPRSALTAVHLKDQLLGLRKVRQMAVQKDSLLDDWMDA
eukprot:gene29620-33330_t